MQFTRESLVEMERYFRDFGMELPGSVVVDDKELREAQSEVAVQHPEEGEREQLARAVARVVYKHLPKPTRHVDSTEIVKSHLEHLPVNVVNLLPERWERISLWVWRLLVLLALWLIFWALPAHAQLDGLQIQNASGFSIKNWAGGIAKLKCGANLTCTLSGTTITMAAGAGGSTAWDAITNPASANLGLTMAAFTTTFTWGATTGAGVSLFRLTDTLNNTGTGCILCVDTASGSAAFPFQATAAGTANGVRMSIAGLLAAIGTGGINATQYKGGNASGTGSPATPCTNQVVTTFTLVDAALPTLTCNTITSAYTSGTFTATAHNLLSAIHGDTTITSAVRGSIIYANITPAWTALGVQSAGKYPRWDGTDLIASTLAASGVGTCTNQFARALNADAAPTCATVAKADAVATFVSTDQANTYTGGGLQDFGASTVKAAGFETATATPPSLSGVPGVCAVSAASEVKLCGSSANNRFAESYNGGAYVNHALTTDILYPIYFGANRVSLTTPADATNYYLSVAQEFTTNDTQQNTVLVGIAGTVTKFCAQTYVSSTLGSNEDVTFSLRKNNATESTETGTQKWDVAATTGFCVTLTTAFTVAANDRLAIHILTPTWITNPANVFAQGVAFVRP